jgi:general secretion pathway protein D
MMLIPAILLIATPIQAADKVDTTDASAAAIKNADGVPLTTVIEAVAKRTQKRYLVDPRVRGFVDREGLDLNKISYRELQAILRLHGFVALEIGGAINVFVDADMRFLQLPVVDKDTEKFGDDDVVVKVISTGKLDAARLVPLLRPMLPQYAHLAGDPAISSLIVVARYGNVKTIEAVVRALEKQPVTQRPVAPGSEPRP